MYTLLLVNLSLTKRLIFKISYLTQPSAFHQLRNADLEEYDVQQLVTLTFPLGQAARLAWCRWSWTWKGDGDFCLSNVRRYVEGQKEENRLFYLKFSFVQDVSEIVRYLYWQVEMRQGCLRRSHKSSQCFKWPALHHLYMGRSRLYIADIWGWPAWVFSTSLPNPFTTLDNAKNRQNKRPSY